MLEQEKEENPRSKANGPDWYLYIYIHNMCIMLPFMLVAPLYKTWANSRTILSSCLQSTPAFQDQHRWWESIDDNIYSQSLVFLSSSFGKKHWRQSVWQNTFWSFVHWSHAKAFSNQVKVQRCTHFRYNSIESKFTLTAIQPYHELSLCACN